MKSANRYLLWLNWPEGAFRLNARSLAVFKDLARGEVKVVRSERAFLRALPEATHAVVCGNRFPLVLRSKPLPHAQSV